MCTCLKGFREPPNYKAAILNIGKKKQTKAHNAMGMLLINFIAQKMKHANVNHSSPIVKSKYLEFRLIQG